MWALQGLVQALWMQLKGRTNTVHFCRTRESEVYKAGFLRFRQLMVGSTIVGKGFKVDAT